MAGVNPNFDATAFEQGIRFAMQMGAPINVTDRATFRFARVSGAAAYPPGTRLDREGRPLDPRVQRLQTSTRADVQVDVAIEFSGSPDTTETPVGKFPAGSVVLTLFQADYERVRDAREVVIGGDEYTVAFRPPPLGLFNVGFQQIVVTPRDET